MVNTLYGMGENPAINTARLVEDFRGTDVQEYMEHLAFHDNLLQPQAVKVTLNDALVRLFEIQNGERRDSLLEKSRENALSDGEKAELRQLLQDRGSRLNG